MTTDHTPPADRAALRDRIAEALRRAPSKELRADWTAPNGPLQITARIDDLADAVLAVLPPPVSRADALREAADIAESLRQFEPATGARKSAQVSENVGILRVADELRRRAACPACPAGIEHDEHCPTPETHNWGCGCPSDVAAAIASCPGREMGPSPCRCPCEGCKHHCGAHDPSRMADEAQPGTEAAS